MKILHVTPHLPPDQAANALLPAHLGAWFAARGDAVTFLAHPPRAGTPAATDARTVWVPALAASGLARALRLASLAAAGRIARAAAPLLAGADIVHLHSNGLLTETVAWLAARRRTPVVLTLYGTEIWHYRPRPLIDLFTRMYRRADRVAFYSRGLHDRAIELGLGRPGLSVVYPPVVERFTPAAAAERAALRARLGLARRHVLVNVKRLHPLAGQRYLIEAFAAVRREHPDTELVICGTGALQGELEAQAAALGLSSHVRFTGLVGNEVVADYNRAADAFVLPSLLEALPTVAVEALACGTPVVSADHPGGVELHGLFGDDVRVVPREDSARLAQALSTFLAAPRRTRPDTAATLDREFRPPAVRDRYLAIYRALAGGGAGA